MNTVIIFTDKGTEHRAVIEGVESGLFDVAAHPDRVFHSCKAWTDDMQALSMKIVEAAQTQDIPFEINVGMGHIRRAGSNKLHRY